MKPETERTFAALLALLFRFVRICSAPGLRSSTVFPAAFARLPAITSASTLVDSLRQWAEFYEETHNDMGPIEITGTDMRRAAAALDPNSKLAFLLDLAAGELEVPGSLVCSSNREPSDRPWAVAARASELCKKEFGDPLAVAFANILLETPNIPGPLIEAAKWSGREAGRRFVQVRARSFDGTTNLDRGWAVEAFACSVVACETIAQGLSLEFVESVFLEAFVEETVAAITCAQCKEYKRERRICPANGAEETRIELYCYACENNRLRRLGAEAGKP